jgi:hypothetical protein
MNKVKTYKNKDREESSTHIPYVPQYKELGLEPTEHKSSIVPEGTTIAKGSTINPRLPRQAIRQEYAVQSSSPVGRGRGLVPNIGNNMEHTWSGVDGDVIDDLSEVDQNLEMIDNNDIVEESVQSIEAQVVGGYAELPKEDVVSHEVSQDNLFEIIKELESESYLLMVHGAAICSGPLLEIQEQASALVFGEHELCEGNPINIEEVAIVKKVKIKMGLFLE